MLSIVTGDCGQSYVIVWTSHWISLFTVAYRTDCLESEFNVVRSTCGSTT